MPGSGSETQCFLRKPLKNVEFGRPVRKRQAQALEIGIPGADFGFDLSPLPAAASDSRGYLPAFLSDLLERPPVAVERGFPAGQRLPALDHYVHVFGIQFDAAADALGQFGGGQRRAAAQEWLVHQFAALQVIEDRAPKKFDRFLRGMIEFLLVRTAHAELRRGRCPDRGVFAGLPKPRRVFSPNEPTGFVLKPVERPRQDRAPLVPNNLLMMFEADAQQAVQNLARELRGVPDVRNLQARHEFESLGPVGPRVSRDGRLSVAFRAVLHVAGLGGILRVSFGGCLARCSSLLSRSEEHTSELQSRQY